MPLRLTLINAGGSSGGYDNPVVIDTSSLPNATVGIFYSATLTAHGGTPPYSWYIDFGALPPGLSLSLAGVISGTPTLAGDFNFIVLAVDPIGNHDSIGVGISL